MPDWKQILDNYKVKNHHEIEKYFKLPATIEQMRSPLLEEKIKVISASIGSNDDLTLRRFRLFGKIEACAVFMSAVVDHQLIHDAILKPLMNLSNQIDPQGVDLEMLPDILLKDCLLVSEGHKEPDIELLFKGIMLGSTALLIDGASDVLLLQSRKIEHRSVEAPQTEQVIRGSREGFVETLETNLSLVRGRLQTRDLTVKISPVGVRTQSRVAVCYIEGIVNPSLVKEALKRISQINTDAIIDSGYIEQFIEDHPMSPFPQIQNTERPDKSVAALLEGRIVILVDNSPFALIIPTMFSQFYQTVDDYTERFMIASLIRMIRLIALIFSLVAPAMYVSIISFNPELVPTDFAVAIAGGRAGVPFPAMIEVLIIEVSMEILREATIRLPQMIGGALSIVGVLVVGQAAVSAGFCSPITVVVVALTTIGSFATPSYNAAIALRMLRFPLIFISGAFGLFGLLIGCVFVLNHLLALESFGVPYLAPIVPGSKSGMKDTLLRGPLWWLTRRPTHLYPMNKQRETRQGKESAIDSAFKGPSRKERPS
jgi:spore germination protein KA